MMRVAIAAGMMVMAGAAVGQSRSPAEYLSCAIEISIPAAKIFSCSNSLYLGQLISNGQDGFGGMLVCTRTDTAACTRLILVQASKRVLLDEKAAFVCRLDRENKSFGIATCPPPN